MQHYDDKHDPALVKCVRQALHHTYRCSQGDEDMCRAAGDPRPEARSDCRVESAIAAIDTMLTWQAKHVKPSVEALIEEIGHISRIGVKDHTWYATAWKSYYGAVNVEAPTLREALLALRDAVKGERT